MKDWTRELNAWNCPKCNARRYGFQITCIKCSYQRPRKEWDTSLLDTRIILENKREKKK